MPSCDEHDRCIVEFDSELGVCPLCDAEESLARLRALMDEDDEDEGEPDPPEDERGLADDSDIDYAREKMWENDLRANCKETQ